MRLNTLSPAPGSKKARKRVGRGIGSGHGKTASRGMKGQKARSGDFHKVDFEGGQTPLRLRIPKAGFRSFKSRYVDEVRLHELNKVEGDVIDMESLRRAGLIKANCRRVRIIAKGEVTRPFIVRGVAVTKGARAAIEAAGGKVEA